jgi:MFS family permease
MTYRPDFRHKPGKNMTISTGKNKLELIKITASILSSIFLAGVDMSVVNIILPSLSNSMNITVDQTAVIVTVYVSMMAATLMFFGRCSDVWPAENLFFIGMLLFTASLFLCGMSTGFYQLVISRGIQGLGAAMAASSSGAVIIRHYPKEKLGMILGFMMMTVGIGNACGPLLGGLLVKYFSWHWIFILQIPVGVLSCFLMGFKGFSVKNRLTERIRELDWQGTLASIAGLPFFLAFLAETTDARWSGSRIYMYLLGFIICALLFVRSENTHPNPLVRFSAFRRPRLSIAVASKALIFVVMQGWLMVFPFFLIQVCRFDSGRVGLIFMIFSLGMLLTTPVAGRIVDKGYAWHIMVLGVFLVGSAIIGAFFLNVRPTNLHLLTLMFFLEWGWPPSWFPVPL